MRAIDRLTGVAALVLLATTGQVSAREYQAVTPSGATEAIFDAGSKSAASAIASKCIDLKFPVISNSDGMVTCEAPMNSGQQILGQLLMGNSYSTAPRRFLRFNIADINGVSRVQANGWMELQMAFGQTRQENLAGPDFHNNMMNFLEAAGARLPPGTTFPNHARMGVEIEIVRSPQPGIRLKSVDADSAAAAASLIAGDVLTKVAGKRVKDDGDLTTAQEKAADVASYPVEFYRDGKRLQATMQTRFRAKIEAPAIAAMAPTEVIAITPVAMTAPASVADELGKLAALKDRGLITQAEFDAQKAKLLGR